MDKIGGGMYLLFLLSHERAYPVLNIFMEATSWDNKKEDAYHLHTSDELP